MALGITLLVAQAILVASGYLFLKKEAANLVLQLWALWMLISGVLLSITYIVFSVAPGGVDPGVATTVYFLQTFVVGVAVWVLAATTPILRK